MNEHFPISPSPFSVIIVAGGSGTRMGASVPKQFLPLGGKPVLMHAIEPFFRYDASISVVVALPAGHIDNWRQLCREHHFTIAHTIVNGGDARGDSVQNALAVLPDDGLIAIHDGVRPFVTPAFIACCFDVAAQCGCAVPVVPVADSLRQWTGNGNSNSRAVPRENMYAVQTPQIFRADWLKEAYTFMQGASSAFTDDASLLEAAGYKITLTDGSRENIKITEPPDWKIAEALRSLFV